MATRNRTPSQRPPSEDQRAKRRQQIIEAAALLFAELGYNECEMERVSAKLSIAKGTLYLYFPSKEALFLACVDHGMRHMTSVVLKAADEAHEPFERITRATVAYLQFFQEHREYVELLLQERAIFKDRTRSTYFVHRDANRTAWHELYANLIVEGRLRNDMTAEEMLDVLGSLVYGAMFTNHFLARSIAPETQAGQLLEVVFRGILSDTERAANSAD